jgi:hypothetical protein
VDVNGFAEATGWVAADDGLLAIDVNGNGIIGDGTGLQADLHRAEAQAVWL